MEKILLTTNEVAAALRVSPSTVRRMVREKTIRAVKIGKTIRFSKEELDRICREGTK